MSNLILKKLQYELGELGVKHSEPMNLHTTFKIGGPAKYYIVAEKIEDIIRVVRLAYKLKLPVFILGWGSNIIVSDKGIDGIVIKNNCKKLEMVSAKGKTLMYAESGVVMNQLVRFTIEQGLSGFEYQLGLPGTLGGAIFMNSNFPKKNSYVGDTLYKASILTKEGNVKEVDNAYFEFAYDRSSLQTTGEILLSAVFKLTLESKDVLRKRSTEVLKYRNKTQPKGVSAGCVFRNISTVEATRIKLPKNITSAGYLIDKAGLRGKRIGNAMISDIHANFILNMGNAKAEDIATLVKLIKSEVFKRFGVRLSLEVRTVGFDGHKA